jgi:uncharacterized membrane protein
MNLMEIPPSTESAATPAGSSTGLETNIASLLAYLLHWISGLVFLLIEKKDETVRWHAAQSFVFSISIFVFFTALSIITTVISFLPFVGWILSMVFSLVFGVAALGVLVVWIILLVKAFQGEKWELPIIGKFIPTALKIKT